MKTTKKTKTNARAKTVTYERPAAEVEAAKTKATEQAAKPSKKLADPRLPESGVIEKTYRGKQYRIEITPTGFRWDGRDWKSLTAIAREVTGAKAISGPLWAGIAKRPAKEPAPQTAEKAPAPKADAKKDGKRATKTARKTTRKGSAR